MPFTPIVCLVRAHSMPGCVVVTPGIRPYARCQFEAENNSEIAVKVQYCMHTFQELLRAVTQEFATRYYIAILLRFLKILPLQPGHMGDRCSPHARDGDCVRDDAQPHVG